MNSIALGDEESDVLRYHKTITNIINLQFEVLVAPIFVDKSANGALVGGNA